MSTAVCRTCLCNDLSIHLNPIFNVNLPENQVTIHQKLLSINLKIQDILTLPKEMCDDCILQLDQAYHFREKSLNAERNLLSKIHHKYFSNASEELAVKQELNPDVTEFIEPLTGVKFDGDHENIEMAVIDSVFCADGEDCKSEEDVDHLNFMEVQLSDFKSYIYFECQICGMCFVKKKAYSKHLQQYHGDEQFDVTNVEAEFKKQFSCKICITEFGKAKVLNKHVLKHLDKILERNELNVAIKTDATCSYRATSTEMTQLDIFSCDICRRVFQKKRLLRNHILRMHLKIPTSKIFKCTEKDCDRSFSTEEQMSSHIIRKHQAHLKHSCQYCKKDFSAKTLRDHIKAQHLNAGRHLCTVCGKTFFSKSKFKDHTTRHIGAKEFICTICSRGFVLKGDLNAHVETHKKLHPYICDICGKKYTKPYSLTKHKRVHTGEKPFSCEFCPMKFRESKGLSSHRRTHTGERPYLCSYESCGKRYSQACHLLSHTRRVHTKEKPYHCDLCEKQFTDSNGLKYHRRTHTGDRPYKCTFEDCGKAFIQSFELTLHTRVHTGERPHTCCDCGSSFMRTSTLNKHRKIHLKSKSNANVLLTVP